MHRGQPCAALYQRGVRPRRGAVMRPFAREPAAVAGVEKALGRQVLGQHHVVNRQFDMPVGDAVDAPLRDRRPVHQVTDRDQHAVDADGMIRRQQQVAARRLRRERMGGDAHRPHVLRPGMAAAIDAAMAQPDCGRKTARCGTQQLARAQALDRDRSPRGRDARAGGEAGGGERKLHRAVRLHQPRALHVGRQPEIGRGGLQHCADLCRRRGRIGLQHQRRDRGGGGRGGGGPLERREARHRRCRPVGGEKIDLGGIRAADIGKILGVARRIAEGGGGGEVHGAHRVHLRQHRMPDHRAGIRARIVDGPVRAGAAAGVGAEHDVFERQRPRVIDQRGDREPVLPGDEGCFLELRFRQRVAVRVADLRGDGDEVAVRIIEPRLQQIRHALPGVGPGRVPLQHQVGLHAALERQRLIGRVVGKDFGRRDRAVRQGCDLRREVGGEGVVCEIAGGGEIAHACSDRVRDGEIRRPCVREERLVVIDEVIDDDVAPRILQRRHAGREAVEVGAAGGEGDRGPRRDRVHDLRHRPAFVAAAAVFQHLHRRRTARRVERQIAGERIRVRRIGGADPRARIETVRDDPDLHPGAGDRRAAGHRHRRPHQVGAHGTVGTGDRVMRALGGSRHLDQAAARAVRADAERPARGPAHVEGRDDDAPRGHGQQAIRTERCRNRRRGWSGRSGRPAESC